MRSDDELLLEDLALEESERFEEEDDEEFDFEELSSRRLEILGLGSEAGGLAAGCFSSLGLGFSWGFLTEGEELLELLLEEEFSEEELSSEEEDLDLN